MPPGPDLERPAVDVRALSKLHGSAPALLDITFSVPSSAQVALVGDGGCGKSTLMKLLAGHMAPSGGRIRISGVDVRTSRFEVTAHIGYVPQLRPGFGDMRPSDLLMFSGRARQIPPAVADQRIRDVARQCGLERVLHNRCDQLDREHGARLALAQALIHQPSVLLLDEFLTPFDPPASRRFLMLLEQLRGRTTVVLSGPRSLLSEFVPDHVLVLDRGRLTFTGALPREMTDLP